MKFAVISYAFSVFLHIRPWKLVFHTRIINIEQRDAKVLGKHIFEFFSTLPHVSFHNKSYEAHKAVFIARSFHALLKKGH